MPFSSRAGMSLKRSGHRDGNARDMSGDFSELRLNSSAPNSSLVPSSSSPSSSSGVSYIEHRVSRFDTLAGIAIKYGVEVSDIKRLNGLVTDLQMFAHKTLQIPLPGRHPPSPILSNGSADQEKGSSLRTPPRYPQRALLKDFQSPKPQRKVSPAMSSLQGYYGLVPSVGNGGNATEGTEMTLYRITSSQVSRDEPPSSPKANGTAGSSLGRHRKSRSLVDVSQAENGESTEDVMVAEAGDNDVEKSSEKSVRRRQKADADGASPSPALILKEENSGGFLGRFGRGLALRPKSASKANLAGIDMETTSNGHAHYAGDSSMASGFAGVRRSSSTSNLQESFENVASSWSATKWLKPDLQALSAVAITRPIFDGLPKPISGKRNKAALD
ncbi:uncharacterized protein LOC116248678 [Nymphaea colorata]|nr:uncharacterized protein LOC116248678 [Nymphaea colorata]